MRRNKRHASRGRVTYFGEKFGRKTHTPKGGRANQRDAANISQVLGIKSPRSKRKGNMAELAAQERAAEAARQQDEARKRAQEADE